MWLLVCLLGALFAYLACRHVLATSAVASGATREDELTDASVGVLGGGDSTRNVMLMYWGRQGALPRFILEMLKETLGDPNIKVTASISQHNEIYNEFLPYEKYVFPVRLFRHPLGAVLSFWRLPFVCWQLRGRLASDNTQLVINLMPHVWTPLIAPLIRRSGVRYSTIIHDAQPHPGDLKGKLNSWMMREAASADVVFTLSQSVANDLKNNRYCDNKKIVGLFHPDLDYGKSMADSSVRKSNKFRLLFLGRILPYKGMPLLLDALDILREQGVEVNLGVYGAGDISGLEARLQRCRAEVKNRWLTEAEIRDALDSFDAVVLSHTEASQSGVVATALAKGLPVIATPVGGIVEQIDDGNTGVLATDVSAQALANAIKRLTLDRQLYAHISETIESTRASRSMSRFVERCLEEAFKDGPDSIQSTAKHPAAANERQANYWRRSNEKLANAPS